MYTEIKRSLENGDYIYVRNIEYIEHLTPELTNLLLEFYPFEEYGVPRFIKNIIEGKYVNSIDQINGKSLFDIINRMGLENISLENILNIYIMYSQIVSDFDEFQNLIFNMVSNKILNDPKEIMLFSDQFYMSAFRRLLPTQNYFFDKSIIFNYHYDLYFKKYNASIAKKLIDNKIYIFAYIALKYKLTTLNDVLKDVAENFDKEECRVSFIYMLEIFSWPKEILKQASQNSALISKLFEYGKLNVLLKLVSFCYDGSIYYRIQELITTSSIFDDDINNLDSTIIQYNNLLETILSCKKLYNFAFLKDKEYFDIYETKFLNLILNYMVNYVGKLIIPKNLHHAFIADIFIKRGEIDELAEWIASVNPKVLMELSTDTKVEIYNNISSNVSALQLILNSQNKYEFIFLSESILHFCLTLEYLDKFDIFQYALQRDDCNNFYTKDVCLILKDFILEKFGVEEENYLYIVTNLGPYILKYLDNPNIIELLKIDMSTLKRIVTLFQTDSYSLAEITSIQDSVMQQKFAIDNPKIMNIYTHITTDLESEHDDISQADSFYQLVCTLKKYFPARFKNTLDKNVLCILEEIKNGNEGYKKYLRQMCRYYIDRKREEYRSTYGIQSLEIPRKINEKSLRSVFTRFLLNNRYRDTFLIDGEEKHFEDLLDEYLMTSGYEKGTAKKFLEQHGDEEKTFNYFDENTLNKINNLAVKYIINNYEVFKQGIDYMYDEFIRDFSLLEKYQIKSDYIVENNKELVYKILTFLNLPVFLNSVLKNDTLYSSLLATFRKYKLHFTPDYIINSLMRHGNFYCGAMEIAALMTYYNRIYELNIKNKYAGRILPIYKLIEIAIKYVGDFSYYISILGSEDFDLIKSNPAFNAATRKLENNERLKEAVFWTINNFKRSTVTIPTFNEIFTSGNKSIRIIVGNFTHPSNLTHGERTGSCMRIGGVGEKLFDFILSNDNGFHIRFEDPETGEYISRVSGFRNGNTVFLNSLRFSLNLNKYSDLDIVDFCTLAAKKIIEYSTDSAFPISNVIISKEEAIKLSGLEAKYLNVANIKKGLPNFYTDFINIGVILATTTKTSDFVPINLGVDNLPTYNPVREVVKYSENYTDLQGLVDRVHNINILLTSSLPYYENENISLKDNFVCGYGNMDWYAYMDKSGEIHFENLGVDMRAKTELENAIAILKSKKHFGLK